MNVAEALSATAATAGGVIINEVVAGSWRGARDADGDAEDWVELYNPGDTFVELTGYGLSNKTATPFLWTFPAGIKIPAKGYLIVWLSKKNRAVSGAPLHTNFNLDSGADGVYLTASNATSTGIAIDSATPPLLRADQSWCRMPSGAAWSPLMACDQPTPGSANDGVANAAILAKPTLTPASGFYAAAQTVTITGPVGAELRYTTDGSEPTATSPAYVAPLKVGSNTVLRVAAFATGSAPSLVETGTYVINAAQASQYTSLKAMMVAISPSDYIAFQANDQTRDFRASFELITGGLTSVFKMDAEGSAGGQFGGASSPQRTMNVKAIDAFGAKAFPGVLWADKPGVKSVKKFRLRNGSNDWDSAHLRDQLSQKLGADGPNLWASSTSVAMFVNGIYYGLMDLREREDETQPSSNLGIDKDFVDYISDPLLDAQEIKNGGDAALASYQAMHNYIVGNDMSVAANYAQARTLMNPESLAWDWALHMFHANYDWPGRNVHVWRSPEVDNRWTWRSHDMDFAFGRYTDANYNMNSSFTVNGSQVINSLLRNSDFRNLYLNAVADQMNVMTPAYMNATLDKMSAEMRPYIDDFYAKNALGTASVWEGKLGAIRDWFNQREAVYDGQNQAEFVLGARQMLTVSVNDTVMGSVKVNLVDTQKYVTAANPTWVGKYYPGVPVTLEAKPKPGYTFVGWQGASTATTRRITQNVTTTTQLTAVFTSAGTPSAPTIAAIAAQARTTGELVALQVSATDPGGLDITYSAKTLPKGLNINPANGMIYGRLTTPGVYKTTVSVTNGAVIGTATIDWNVADRPGTGLLGTSPDNGVSTMNSAPTITWVSPLSGTVVAAGTTINLNAAADDVDGTIVKVEYFDGANLIGTSTASPFSVTWSGASTGSHLLTARATDNDGATTTSAAVAIYVGTPSSTPPANAVTCAAEGGTCTLPTGTTASVWYGANSSWVVRTGVAGSIACTNAVFTDPVVGTAKACRYVVTNVPASNTPPSVSITAPANNSSVLQGAVISLTASATDTDGNVAKVEYFDGATLVGTATSAPWAANWTNASAGTHVLTARATDNLGATATSTAINIVVTSSTNTPPANAISCASEGGTCTLPTGTTASVWYGANSSWVVRTGVAGSIACTNAVFTDPVVGTVKGCRYVVTATLQ